MEPDKERQRIKEIRDYILKTGFPSEVEIGNILRKRSWLVINQFPYMDKETQKIRAVDIFALKLGLPFPVFGFSIIIECKKAEKHCWVFHTQQKEAEFLPALATIIDFVKKLDKPPFAERIRQLATADSLSSLFGIKPSLVGFFEKLAGLHALNKNIKIGVFNVLPSPKSRDDFLEATQQANSALESMSEITKSSIVIPVIVFDGEIYEFYQDNNDIKVFPTNHVQFISFGKDRMPFLIDVLRKSYFEEFLTIIEKDFQILSDFIGTVTAS